MIGRWKLRCCWIAYVDTEQGELLFGWIYINGSSDRVPSYWTKTGNSLCHDFDLVERIAGPGYFGERKTN